MFPVAIGKARESANLHSHGEIVAFDVRRANLRGIGMPDNWDRLGGYHFCRRIASLTFGNGAINFDELREVYSRAQRQADRLGIRLPAVRSDLKMFRRGVI